MRCLSPLGLIVQEEWLRSRLVRSNVTHDEYAVMPNHVHGILILREPVGATRRVAPTTRPHSGPLPGSLAAIIAQFKGQSARRINVLRGTPASRVGQCGFFDHVIRDEQGLLRVREYLLHNPLRWALDKENPSRSHLSGPPA